MILVNYWIMMNYQISNNDKVNNLSLKLNYFKWHNVWMFEIGIFVKE